MLRAGGNAVDAAIAAALMSCVCEPVLSSPGGGGFAMVKTGRSDPELFDFFAQTPRHPNPEATGFDEVVADFGPATQRFHIGPASAAMPGFVPGLVTLHAAGATMKLSDLAAPAIAAARNGFAMTAFQAHLAEIVSPILLATERARALFAPGGKLPVENAIWKNEDIASFFEKLSADPYAFNREEFVPTLLNHQADGHLRQEDFDSYEVVRRAPLTFRLSDATIFTNPAPAAGGILVAHTLANLGGDTPLHHAEALQQTDRSRRESGGDLERLLAALGPMMTRGTTHVSVMDSEGGAVAMTLTNGEGNGRIAGDFGFMLNNMLGEEDVNPHGAEGWPAGVRLASMMAPTIAMRDDGELLVLGSGGSNRIRSAIAQVLAHAVLNNKPIDQSVLAPRLHVEENHLEIEAGFSTEEEELLQERFPSNRVWPDRSMFFGGCHAVSRAANGKLAAAGDPRRAGAGLVL
ncbi:MAG: gamma-glutamyltransferase [Hyphomicrobiaceae bacterium]|nr:gamma-glutamyltransferase [Hyphomicrobiaceae bacterium]